MAISYYKKYVMVVLLCMFQGSNMHSSSSSFFSYRNMLAGTTLLGLVAAGGYYVWGCYTRTPIQNDPYEWHHPRNIFGKEHPTEAIYAPALFQSEMTTTYYTGSYTASTGEKFTCTDPFLTLHPDHTASCNFGEIYLEKNNSITLDSKKKLSPFSTLFSFLFKLGDMGYQKLMHLICDNPNSTKSVKKYCLDFDQLNIGQSQDIYKLSEAYNHSSDIGSDMVMYGFSRGAATTFNFLATVYKHKPYKRVKAAVLAGCFDSIKNIFVSMLGKEYALSLYSGIVKYFTALQHTNRYDPINLAEQFPYDIPLLLVASKADGIVPYDCTVALYNKLKATGHKQVYLLTLENAGHPGHLFRDNANDRERYLHTVHAFYKHCGISYIPTYADQGAELLATCMTM